VGGCSQKAKALRHVENEAVPETLCFPLLAKECSLDLEANSPRERDTLVSCYISCLGLGDGLPRLCPTCLLLGVINDTWQEMHHNRFTIVDNPKNAPGPVLARNGGNKTVKRIEVQLCVCRFRVPHP
jgi:hypothetical protein